MDFRERIARAQLPHFDHAREQVLGEEQAEIATKLCAIPRANEELREISISREVYVVDFGRFYSLADFASQSTVIRRRKGRPSAVVYGWSRDPLAIDRNITPEQTTHRLRLRSNLPVFEKISGTSYGLEDEGEDPKATQCDLMAQSLRNLATDIYNSVGQWGPPNSGVARELGCALRWYPAACAANKALLPAARAPGARGRRQPP